MHRGNTEPVIKRMIELPSPRGVRVASEPHGHRDRLRRGCRPREGCGLHHKRNLLEDQIEAHLVAVPVRGAGCIPHGKQQLQGQELHHFSVPVRGAGCIGVVRKKNNFITLLPSPWGARAASTAIPQYLPKGTEVAVPVGGRRLHLEMIPWSAIQTGRTLPSPRGVRVASK